MNRLTKLVYMIFVIVHTFDGSFRHENVYSESSGTSKSYFLTTQRSPEEIYHEFKNNGRKEDSLNNKEFIDPNLHSNSTLKPGFTNGSLQNGSNALFDPKKRSDGYNLTKAEDSPYAVLLFVFIDPDELVGICSGSILTPEWVLSAAHCIFHEEKKVAFVVVEAGSDAVSEAEDQAVQTLKSIEMYSFPQYAFEFDHDVSLIKLEGKFNLTKTVNQIHLSTQPWKYHSYVDCKIVGFGRVAFNEEHPDDHKRKTHLLRTKQPCICMWKLKQLHGKQVARRYICSQPREDYGICSGDSGGGLVCEGKIRAVAMAIYRMNPKNLCEIESYQRCGSVYGMNLFLDTCPYAKWINSLVQVYSETEISEQCDYKSECSCLDSMGVYTLLVIFSISYYCNNILTNEHKLIWIFN